MVCSVLAKVHLVGPIRTRNFFDDMVSRIASKDGDIVRVLVNHGARLAGEIAAARLKHNETKTVVVASNLKLAREVVKELKEKHNVVLKCCKSVVDLGLDAGGGLRRPASGLQAAPQSRWRRCRHRARAPANVSARQARPAPRPLP